MFRAGGVFCDGSFYVPSVVSNVLLRFRLEEKEISLLEMPIGYHGAWSAACDGKRVWLAPRHHKESIVYYDISCQTTGMLDYFPEGFTGEDDLFLRCIYRNGFIWMYPEKANMGVKINPDTFEVTEMKELDRLKEDETYGCWFIEGRYLYGIRKKRDIEWIKEAGNENFKLNLDTWKKQKFCFYFCKGFEKRLEDIADIYKNRMKRHRFEGKNVTLEEFLMLVPYMHKQECSEEGDWTEGKHIYSAMLKDC